MPVSNNVVNMPVSVDDIQEVLGATSDSVKPLCQDSHVSMMSKYKPTDFIGGGFAVGTNGIELAWRGNPKDSLYIGCGFSMASLVLDVSTQITSVNDAVMSLYNYLEGSTSYPYALISASGGAMTAQSSRISPSYGRLSDFYRYTHNPYYYKYGGSRPFSISCSLPQSGGRNVIDAGAQIFYQYDSVSDGIGAHLGVNDLFSIEYDSRMATFGGQQFNVGTKRAYKFFGVMVWNPRTTTCVISRDAITTIGTTADPVTGLTDARAVFFPTSSLVDGTGSKGFKYGDSVYVLPFILAKNTLNKYVFFGMNIMGMSSTSKTLLDSSSAPSYTNMRVTSLSATITYYRVEDRTYDIYFSSVSSFTFNLSGYRTSADNRIYFTTNQCSILPADSTGNLQSYVTSNYGTNYDAKSGYRYSTFSSNSGNGAHLISGTMSYSGLRSRIQFSGSGTSAKVSVLVPVYQNNGSTGMERKYYNLEFTIDPRKTGTNTATAVAS